MTGTIKKILRDKGFGFIISNGKEYFFHRNHFTGNWNNLANEMEKGNPTIRVEFKEVASGKGPRAEEVIILIPENNKFYSLEGD